jgi:hypothetical protein
MLWHISVIPAFGKQTQEDFEFKARLRYIVRCSKTKGSGMVVYTCNPSFSGGEIRGLLLEASPGKKLETI